ncbi:hypothetical protein LC586_37920 [Nostoc sp. CHAB 5714]|uniref:Secreted protein n=1 Tax=Nostoc favosum CHAB5714 TaxID=2780399 RepID=A0ABS8IKR7_9NOSO|nr:hypothetical protein [Nostoc favosum CHAB5714]
MRIRLLLCGLSLLAFAAAASAQMVRSHTSTVGQTGKRQSGGEAAETLHPMIRIDNRVRTRIDTRIRSRIVYGVEAQTNALAPLEKAARDVQRQPLRPDR